MRDFPDILGKDGVTHYTCQSVDVSKVKKAGIKLIGDTFGIEPREVLFVPYNTIKKFGKFARSSVEAQVSIEQILRKL